MKLKLLGILILSTGLLFNGCAQINESGAVKSTAKKTLTAPSPAVQSLIDKHQLEIVDYAYTLKAVGEGTRNGATALLIDARPNLKYLKGTIPSSISIPDTQIDKYKGQLDKVAKDKEIIVFCGGWKCEKSPIVAGYLKDNGFTNVKLYQAGEPQWRKMNYSEVGIPVVKAAMDKDSAVLMDARPRKKYIQETIPGAMYMYDKELEKLSGRFPADKTTPIITFCGGYSCNKSHIVANKLKDLGYKNVTVFAAGLPGWKKADMPTTANAQKAAPAPAVAQKAVFVDGIKVGADEGTVDGEWFNALIQSSKIPANVVLIDVRPPVDFAAGHMKGSINIEAGKLSVSELVAKLPKGKVSIFTCGTGARAMEALMKLQEAKQDVSKVMYFDANITCTPANTCKVEVNEPLG